MISDDAKPSFETSKIGTPLDYTEDLYTEVPWQET